MIQIILTYFALSTAYLLPFANIKIADKAVDSATSPLVIAGTIAIIIGLFLFTVAIMRLRKR